MTMPIQRLCAILLCAATLSSPVRASDDQSSRIGTEKEFMEEAGLDSSTHVPGGTSLADFAEETREPFGRGNELPGQVRNEIGELKDQKMMNEFLNPAEVAVIDGQLEAARVRLAIAEKRQKRDVLRKQKKPREAAKLEPEIHQLKAKLATLSPKKNGLTNLLKDDED